MYSRKIQAALRKKGLNIGDRILLTKRGKKFEGLLMPQTKSGDAGTIVLKLDNGYNIGIEFERGTSLSRSRTKEPEPEKREAAYELGKKGSTDEIKFDQKKPIVSMISVGGTITSKVDYKSGGVTTLNRPTDVLLNVSEITDITNMKNILTPFTIMSESMNHTHWQSLARECARELNKRSVDGVIVTHGTDTLHFTSAALSFFLKNLGKPVVVTGSQRSADRGSSDAGMNLICSSHAALSDIAEVGICMHGNISDDYCLFSRGTHVRKMDTQRRDAFRPINEYPFAKIWPDGKISMKNDNHNKRDNKKVVEVDAKFEPKIAMLQTYPGSDPGVMEHLIKQGYKGFILQATGLGQVPSKTKSWLPAIKRATGSGVPVFLAAQTIYGRLNCNVYSEGRAALDAGAVPLGDMLAETAYVKLGWVLAHTKTMNRIRDMMLTSYSGEINPRTLVGSFLY